MLFAVFLRHTCAKLIFHIVSCSTPCAIYIHVVVCCSDGAFFHFAFGSGLPAVGIIFKSSSNSPVVRFADVIGSHGLRNFTFAAFDAGAENFFNGVFSCTPGTIFIDIELILVNLTRANFAIITLAEPVGIVFKHSRSTPAIVFADKVRRINFCNLPCTF